MRSGPRRRCSRSLCDSPRGRGIPIGGMFLLLYDCISRYLFGGRTAAFSRLCLRRTVDRPSGPPDYRLSLLRTVADRSRPHVKWSYFTFTRISERIALVFLPAERNNCGISRSGTRLCFAVSRSAASSELLHPLCALAEHDRAIPHRGFAPPRFLRLSVGSYYGKELYYGTRDRIAN